MFVLLLRKITRESRRLPDGGTDVARLKEGTIVEKESYQLPRSSSSR